MRGKKMKRVKQFVVVMIGLIWLSALMIGCGQSKLSDTFDEETIKEEAMRAIGYFNEKNYQGLIDMGSKELKESITVEELAKASDPYLDKCGTFKEITKTVVVGNKDSKTGNEYGGVVMIGKYEDGKIQFTIAFDQDMKLVQFLIK